MLAMKMLTKIGKRMRTLGGLQRAEIMEATVIVLIIYVLILFLHL